MLIEIREFVKQQLVSPLFFVRIKVIVLDIKIVVRSGWRKVTKDPC